MTYAEHHESQGKPLKAGGRYDYIRPGPLPAAALRQPHRVETGEPGLPVQVRKVGP